MKENTKEEIRNRMLRKAATLWGIPANEIEMSFDPIVALLITACAAEIEKISGEIDESQTRITEKIIQLMTPEYVFGARPAHSILYTEPLDEKLNIKPEYLFTYKKKVSYKNVSENFKDIYFSPVQDFNLANAQLKYIATGNTISQLSTGKQFLPMHKIDKNGALPPSTLYLGIVTEAETIDLKEVSLYFEQQNIKQDAVFYHHLKNAEWFVNDVKIKSAPGFFDSDKSNQAKINSIFNKISNKTHNIESLVINNYKKQYVTIKESLKKEFQEVSSFKELSNVIATDNVKFTETVRWIKVVFPRVVNNTMLETVYCSLNAVPVLNRKINSFTYQMKEFIDIIPVTTEDLFLDIKSLTNTNGRTYISESKDDSVSEKGTFTIRTDNIGKLDHRKAKEYITHLIELLKDESASFSFYNNDFLLKNLKTLNQLIALLENKVLEISNEITETNYIALKPYKKKENLLIDYWTTNGDEANNIKSGSMLKAYSGVGIKQKSTVLLATTHGGKNDLSMNERLNAYRRTLLSRDRIVSKEDVKAFCYEMYNDKIEHVNITKGYTTDLSINKGMLQCINIELTPNKDIKTEQEEWDIINSSLLLHLEKYSVSVFPYKIKLIA